MVVVDAKYGSGLMNLWGNDGWGEVNAIYMLWNDCAIFALMPIESGLQVHMAMPEGDRVRARKAVKAMLDVIGGFPLVAPILAGRKSVENMVIKFGFHKHSTQTTEHGEVTCYVRSPDGRSN